MATGAEEHLFEKLRIDTSTPKPVVSPFHSLTDKKQHYIDECTNGAVGVTSQGSLLTSSISKYPAFDSTNRPAAVAQDVLPPSDNLFQKHEDRHGIEATEADATVPAGSSSYALPVNAPTRRRGASVSFDPLKTFDDGHQASLEESLSEAGGTVAIPCNRRIDDALPSRSSSESEKVRVNPFTGEVLTRRKPRRAVRIEESNQPLSYEATESSIRDAEYNVYSEPTSLNSRLLELSIADQTSLAFGDGGSFVESPLPVSSPISLSYQGESTTAWHDSRTLSGRPVFNRANTLSGSGSLRRANRKSSARSAPSTTSPAGAFLSQWAREEAISTAQPDDEGQEIGDHSEYIIGRQIGYGGFSVVKEAFTIEDGAKVRKAVKIVRKHVSGATELENEKLQADFEHEVGIWRFLRHRYVLPLLAVYDSPFATFCITQYNEGGTLFDLVKNARKQADSRPNNGNGISISNIYENNDTNASKSRGIPQHLARRYSYQLASALRYLHEDVHVVHRDVKLENCLLDMSGPEADMEGGNVLLCDFGMADFVNNESRPSPPLSPSPSPSPLSPLEAASVPPYAEISRVPDPDYHLRQREAHQHSSTFPIAAVAPAGQSRMRKSAMSASTAPASVAGSLAYVSPESLSCPRPLFWPVVDVWAYGVVTHALLIGSLPFAHAFEPKLFTMIRKGEWDEEALRVAGIEDVAVDVLRGCLETDTEQRWTIGEVLEACWFDGCKEMLGDISGLGAW